MRKYLGLNKGESSIKGVCIDIETYLFREIDPFSSEVLLSIENVREEQKFEEFVSKLEREAAREEMLERVMDNSENSDISLDENEEEKTVLQAANLRLR
jgi:DNA-binding transcriptional regulator YbjK